MITHFSNWFSTRLPRQQKAFACPPLGAAALCFLLVTSANAAPTILAIDDDQSGGPVPKNSVLLYTVSFSAEMDSATVDTSDFGNSAASPAVNIEAVTKISPTTFAVFVVPTGSGTLQLEISAGAVLKDSAGDALDTSLAIIDDTAITVSDVGATLSPSIWHAASIPDFLNVDVGDLSTLPTWDNGENSTTPSFETAMATVLDEVALDSPELVLVAGDLVMGRWEDDVSRGLFGTFDGNTSDLTDERAVIDASADFYYDVWKQRFVDRGLTIYAALGDHEIGDNPWTAGSLLAHLVPDYKEAFARHFTKDASGDYLFPDRPVGTAYEGTAYAFRHGNVQFVTIDVFHQQSPLVNLGSQGSVEAEVQSDQLAWLDGVLSAARADPAIDHIIVQGHTPVLAPVRTQHSSGLMHNGAASSAFWQKLTEYDVDLYFAGEVHHNTASCFDGVVQVAHGGLLGYASNINHLDLYFSDKAVYLFLRGINVTIGSGSNRMWQVGNNRPQKVFTLDPAGYTTTGMLIIDKSSGVKRFRNQTGFLSWYGTTPPSLKPSRSVPARLR